MPTKPRAKRKPKTLNQFPSTPPTSAEDSFIGAIKDTYYDQQDRVLSGIAIMAKMDLDGFVGGRMLAHFVVKAQEHILRVGDAEPGDAARARTQYTKALTEARRVLGSLFDSHYRDCLADHNKCARETLDRSNGTLHSYVIPRFNDDGTHDPLGPSDFPWGAK